MNIPPSANGSFIYFGVYHSFAFDVLACNVGSADLLKTTESTRFAVHVLVTVRLVYRASLSSLFNRFLDRPRSPIPSFCDLAPLLACPAERFPDFQLATQVLHLACGRV